MAKISLTPSQYQHQWNGVEQAAKLLSDVRVFSVKEAVQFVTDQIEGDLPSLGEICGTSRSSEVCEICMTSREKSIGCANSSCSHWFCNDCWVEFSTEQIRNGRVPLRCPVRSICQNSGKIGISYWFFHRLTDAKLF